MPAVVLAHQQGVGLSAYRRRVQALTVVVDRQYTLRGERRRSCRGKEIVVWHACTFGREIGEIMPSTRQSDVAAELRRYINDGGASRMMDVPDVQQEVGDV
ncbi:MAG TPA: hypothetical protein PKJ47_13620 [Candidatus Limiplasma sp.]|nr:hypothetical protein [Candidatus Limiplasma sp.]